MSSGSVQAESFLSLMITFKALSVKVKNLKHSLSLECQMQNVTDHPTEQILLSDSRCSGHLLAHVQTNWTTGLSSSRHELVCPSALASDWKPLIEGRFVWGIGEQMLFWGIYYWQCWCPQLGIGRRIKHSFKFPANPLFITYQNQDANLSTKYFLLCPLWPVSITLPNLLTQS